MPAGPDAENDGKHHHKCKNDQATDEARLPKTPLARRFLNLERMRIGLIWIRTKLRITGHLMPSCVCGWHRLSADCGNHLGSRCPAECRCGAAVRGYT